MKMMQRDEHFEDSISNGNSSHCDDSQISSLLARSNNSNNNRNVKKQGRFVLHKRRVQPSSSSPSHSEQPQHQHKHRLHFRGNNKHQEEDMSTMSTVCSLNTTTTTSSRRIRKNVEDIKIVDGRSKTGIYTGQIDSFRQLPHGRGVMKYTDGSIYDGDWYDGDWSGCGTYHSTAAAADATTPTTRTATKTSTGRGQQGNGPVIRATYEGAFLDNHKHGVFVVHYEDGRSYDGSFDLNTMQRGYMTIPMVGRYYGDFDRDEQPHGRGKLMFNDGRQYDGEFYHGQISGHGRMIYGNVPVSSLSPRSDDSMNEEGDMDIDSSHSSSNSTYSSGSCSTCSSKNSTSYDYSFYLGSFSNGKRFGEGILMIDEEIIHDGFWHDDEPVLLSAPSSLAGMAQWIPTDTKRQRCLGRIPQGIKPHSRSSHRQHHEHNNKNKKTITTTRRARHMLTASQ